MASAKDELAILKLRAARRQGGDAIILIDHSVDSRYTCTIADGIKWLANLCEKGGAEHMIHCVDQRAEKERKLTNPKKSTKRIFNCRTPEQWRELNVALEPYYEIAVDPQIAVDFVIRALKAQTQETIRTWLAAGHQQEGDRAPGPPKAEVPSIPEWMK